MKRRFLVVMIVLLMLNTSGANDTKLRAAAGGERKQLWYNTFHVALMRYWHGDYDRCMELLRQTVEISPPAEGVHYSVQLIRKAFEQRYDMEDLSHQWPAEAMKYVQALQKGEKTSDAELVLLAVLSPNWKEAKVRLERIMAAERKSPWADWARWEWTRLLAENASLRHESAGIVETGEGENLEVLYVAEFPKEEMMGRMAEKMLMERRGSYMREQLVWDMVSYRFARFHQAFNGVRHNSWFVDEAEGFYVPLSEEQRRIINQSEETLKRLNDSAPPEMKAKNMATKRLGEFLWGSGQNGTIHEYVWQLSLAEAVLPEEVAAWAKKLGQPKDDSVTVEASDD